MHNFAIIVETHYMLTKYLISIVGPTAIGKTALSIKLAEHFNSEIISSDSRQFFKEMNIGTAVPTKQELNQIKHHFIQNKSIHENYNVGEYEKESITFLKDYFKKNNIIVMVGGSGLYVNAVTKGLDEFPIVDPSIRTKLNAQLQTDGIVELQNKLKQLDFETYNTIALENPQRLIRALEVCIGTNKPYSSFLSNSKKKRPFITINIGLNAERNILYDRINKRVDIMMDNGLLNEVEQLLPFKHLNALNTVGYKEIFKYLDGDFTLDLAIAEIKKNTRRFAKRQLTWFRKDKDIKWFDYQVKHIEIIDYLESKIK